MTPDAPFGEAEEDQAGKNHFHTLSNGERSGPPIPMGEGHTHNAPGMPQLSPSSSNSTYHSHEQRDKKFTSEPKSHG